MLGQSPIAPDVRVSHSTPHQLQLCFSHFLRLGAISIRLVRRPPYRLLSQRLAWPKWRLCDDKQQL